MARRATHAQQMTAAIQRRVRSRKPCQHQQTVQLFFARGTRHGEVMSTAGENDRRVPERQPRMLSFAVIAPDAASGGADDGPEKNTQPFIPVKACHSCHAGSRRAGSTYRRAFDILG